MQREQLFTAPHVTQQARGVAFISLLHYTGKPEEQIAEILFPVIEARRQAKEKFVSFLQEARKGRSNDDEITSQLSERLLAIEDAAQAADCALGPGVNFSLA